MLKLIYDVKCGFKDLYITEKNIEQDLTLLVEGYNECAPAKEEMVGEKDLYEMFKDKPRGIFKFFGDFDSCIRDVTIEDYGHSYFKDICFADKDRIFLPGYFRLMNVRLVYSENE